MSRRLGWVGLALLVLGAGAAFAMRRGGPETLLQWEFRSDPASLLLVAAVLAASPFLAAGLLSRWQKTRLERALTAQAAAQETERRRFIQRLDHELKNPLTAIQIQLDNWQAARPEHSEAVGEVRTQAERLAQLTRGLRRLADLETRPLELETIGIGELLDEAIDLLQAGDRISLDVQKVPWPVPPVEGDRELLLMAFRNLADNALKYSAVASQVQIRARHTSGELVVEIIDTGRGIDPAELPLVTEELYRGSNVHDVPGSGLGLALARRVFERHRGGMELRSRPGQGTIATAHLPYEQ